MPLYEMTPTEFRPITTASFATLQVRERDDLQRLLRTQIEVLGDDLYVLSEEFGDWDDSRRIVGHDSAEVHSGYTHHERETLGMFMRLRVRLR